jgi:hypothetical protein
LWRWLVRVAEPDLRQLDVLDRSAADWRRLTDRRRSFRAPDTVTRLLRHPATTVRSLQRELGMTFGRTQLPITDIDQVSEARSFLQGCAVPGPFGLPPPSMTLDSLGIPAGTHAGRLEL